MNKTEWDTTLHAYKNGLDLNAHLESDIQNWMEADLTWVKLSPYIRALKLADGVILMNLGPGHSWGMLGLMVKLPSGCNYLLVSDAIYTRKNQCMPQSLPALLSDTEGYRKTIEYIESYASKHNATIIYGHDMEQYQSLKTKGCIL